MELLYDRYICALRVCEFEFDRDTDRRHRRAGGEPEIRYRAAGIEGGGGGTMANFMSACIVGMFL